ncbi:MAG: hypothetical protein LBI77_00135 [Puniceicoccales bacterium]|jgi:tyrosine-specific transport protein|nr:hypothetical protein [Puniceicoccales bacterium]
MNKFYTKQHRFLNAIFLVAGTSIGASELGLPVALRHSGYLPAVVGMLGIYICMLASGILLAKLFIGERQRNLPALFQKYLGGLGATLFNGSYFSLAFCLLVAYWSGIQSILSSFHGGLFTLIVLLIAAIGIYYCLRHNFRLLYFFNTILTIGLILSFIFLVLASFRSSSLSLFHSTNWSQLPSSLPLILCSFGYHQVIPMVCQQLDYDRRVINRALLAGTLFPLIFNIIILTIGFRLFSTDELSEAARLGMPVFVLLKEHFHSNFFVYVGQCFSFFAIATSLLGVSMALRGALYDIFEGQKILQRSTELLIIFPLFIAIVKPQLFFTVLGLAGGIFGNLMAGLLPTTPFLKAGYFRFRYLLLWLAFVAVFVLECVNLCSS